ncbi:LLM class flavin-dependent oxidoreductase [Streptomyces halobius]|uniref:LLM class flavin-dependent oxidoreductase n=1 Tax=Streptomyces halobius TaxID=2879846 RepID=A0ABY4M3X3_9ACTN|nr:LLM class flavin-dependent oxidoreductase [Streptomyces halobius]UQA92465.1 LLM class flavin-dependent oxidoreductase [Streptomyces halobius]
MRPLGPPFGDPAQLLTWARRADTTPFTAVALPGRPVFGAPEPLITLATLAGATSRIRLQAEVPLTPPHGTELLAQQAATLDLLTGGRFTLGFGPGGRPDECDECDDRDECDEGEDHDGGPGAGACLRTRSRRLDARMATLRRIRTSAKPTGDVGPAPARPGVLFGGATPTVAERVARWGDGFVGAALPSQQMDLLFRYVETAWGRAGRTGHPRLLAQVDVALGPRSTVDRARQALRTYYQSLGPADHMVDGILTSRDEIRDAVAGYTAIGADEVLLHCWSSDPEQIDRLADALFPPDGDWPGIGE